MRGVTLLFTNTPRRGEHFEFLKSVKHSLLQLERRNLCKIVFLWTRGKPIYSGREMRSLFLCHLKPPK